MKKQVLDKAAHKRLSIAGASGIFVELVNKLAPFFIYHLAEKRLGIEKFGESMVGVSLIEVLLPFVVFGYAHHGTIQVAQVETSVLGRRKLVSDLLALRLIHLVILIGLGFVVWVFDLPYANLMPMLASLSFVLLSGAYELVWFEVATQRVFYLNIMTMFSRFSSLALVYLLVESPKDYVLFAMLTLSSVFLVNTLSFLDVWYRLRLMTPNLIRMKKHFSDSKQYALLMIFIVMLERIDILLAEHLFGSSGAGIFAGPARIGHSLIQVIGALTTAFFAEMIILKKPEKLAHHLQLALWMMIVFWSPIIVGSTFVGGDLLVFVFSENYRNTGPLLTWIIIGGAASSINSALGVQVLLVLGRIRFWLFNLALGVFCCGSCGWYFGSVGGIIGLAKAIVWTKLALMFSVAVYVRSTCVTYRIKPLLLALVPAISMGAILWILPKMTLWSTIIVGVICYILILIMIFKNQMKKFLGLLK